MPILFYLTAISGSYPDMAVNYYENIFINLIGIFYPPGADPTCSPISLQQLHGPLPRPPFIEWLAWGGMALPRE
jgi:hypothetical protein